MYNRKLRRLLYNFTYTTVWYTVVTIGSLIIINYVAVSRNFEIPVPGSLPPKLYVLMFVLLYCVYNFV